MSAPDDSSLACDVAGLHWRNPFVVGSGPTTKRAEQLVEAERCGWAGAAIKLTIDPPPYINREPRYRWSKRQRMHFFTAEKRLTLDEGLLLVNRGRSATTDLNILANVTYAGDQGLGGWAEMAARFEAAGAHAVELNFCCPNMSYNLEVMGSHAADRPQSGASLGQQPGVVADVTRAVKARVGIPVFCKLTPEGGNVAQVARAAVDAGADAVSSTANRLGLVDFDVTRPRDPAIRLQDRHSLVCLSGPYVRPLGLRDVYEIRAACGYSPALVAYGGVASHEDAIRYAMLGADLIGVCTHTMIAGFGFLQSWLDRLRAYMAEMGFNSWTQMRDLLLEHVASAADLELYAGHARLDPQRCTACGLCARIGHCDAIESVPDKPPVIHTERCQACGSCVDVCPSGAIDLIQSGPDQQSSSASAQ